jgi:hypothetical protein
MYNITPADYGIPQPQNFDIIEDDRGLIYLGNNGGVFVFDGVTWKLIKGLDNKALCFSKNDEGTIFVGGENNLGYISNDSIGNAVYKSLIDSIPDTLRNFGRMNHVASVNGEMIYFSETNFFWFSKEMHFLGSEQIEYTGFFRYNNQLYLNQKGRGLTVFSKGNFNDLINGNQTKEFSNFYVNQNTIYAINTSQRLAFRIENESIETISQQRLIRNKEMSINEIKDLEYIDRHYLIATRNNGLLILDSLWSFRKSIYSGNSEIQSNFIWNIFKDSDQNIPNKITLYFGIA